MLNNAIYKCNLFLMSGTVGRAAGSDDLEDMGGLASHLPVTFVCGLVSGRGDLRRAPVQRFRQQVADLPRHDRTGAIARWPVTLLVVAVFGSALTLASFVKVIYSAFLSPAPRGAARSGGDVRESFLLAAADGCPGRAACVLLGLWPGLATETIISPGIPAGATVGEPVVAVGGSVWTDPVGLWDPTQATVLLLIGILLGMILVWLTGQKVRVVRPFLAGEVPAATDDRFPRARHALLRDHSENSCHRPSPGAGPAGGDGPVQLVRQTRTHLRRGAASSAHRSDKPLRGVVPDRPGRHACLHTSGRGDVGTWAWNT